MRNIQPLPPNFYARPTEIVARDLIGTCLVHVTTQGILSGIIIETEAYGHANDPASHAYRRKTERNFPMFGPVGRSYVYFVYGNHYCCNVVAHTPDAPAGAVLIRALLPIEGIALMQTMRMTPNIQNLTNGPGKLTQALGITSAHHNLDLTSASPLQICEGIAIAPSAIVTTPRIGIRVGRKQKWRFVSKQAIIKQLHSQHLNPATTTTYVDFS